MTFVPTRRRVMLVVAAVAGCALVAAITAIVDLVGLRATGAGRGGADGITHLRSLLLLAELGVFALAAVAWLTWQHRAHANLLALGDRPRFSPSRAVGAWFVPVLNLLHAPRAIHELSVLSRRMRARTAHLQWLAPRFRAWWITFSLSLVAFPAALASLAQPSSGATRALMLTHFTAATLRVAAAAFAIRIALDIAARQERRFAMQRFRVVEAA